MSAIDEVFFNCAHEGRGAFIPFLMAGDPDLNATAEYLEALAAGGADMVAGYCADVPHPGASRSRSSHPAGKPSRRTHPAGKPASRPHHPAGKPTAVPGL